MHLVLEGGRCYRIWVGADGAVEATLEDEHGHRVAGAAEGGWLDEVCPRWSGSFGLVLAPGLDARAGAVLIGSRAAGR